MWSLGADDAPSVGAGLLRGHSVDIIGSVLELMLLMCSSSAFVPVTGCRATAGPWVPGHR